MLNIPELKTLLIYNHLSSDGKTVTESSRVLVDYLSLGEESKAKTEAFIDTEYMYSCDIDESYTSKVTEVSEGVYSLQYFADDGHLVLTVSVEVKPVWYCLGQTFRAELV